VGRLMAEVRRAVAIARLFLRRSVSGTPPRCVGIRRAV